MSEQSAPPIAMLLQVDEPIPDTDTDVTVEELQAHTLQGTLAGALCKLSIAASGTAMRNGEEAAKVYLRIYTTERHKDDVSLAEPPADAQTIIGTSATTGAWSLDPVYGGRATSASPHPDNWLVVWAEYSTPPFEIEVIYYRGKVATLA